MHWEFFVKEDIMELKLYLNYKCESIFKPYGNFGVDMTSKNRDKIRNTGSIS